MEEETCFHRQRATLKYTKVLRIPLGIPHILSEDFIFFHPSPSLGSSAPPGADYKFKEGLCLLRSRKRPWPCWSMRIKDKSKPSRLFEGTLFCPSQSLHHLLWDFVREDQIKRSRFHDTQHAECGYYVEKATFQKADRQTDIRRRTCAAFFRGLDTGNVENLTSGQAEVLIISVSLLLLVHNSFPSQPQLLTRSPTISTFTARPHYTHVIHPHVEVTDWIMFSFCHYKFTCYWWSLA